MAIQGRHEALAKAHDLPVALASGVKVRTTGGTADGQACQGVLVGLLKAQKFYYRGVYRGVEPQAALVGPMALLNWTR